MIKLSYEVVDVFTDRPFTGNPLAVVFGADELSGDQMQSVAREFNLSETIFVLPATTAGATYRVRIFTPATELPFAGHPSIGSAVTQLRRGLIQAGDVVQECGVGLLPISVSTVPDAPGRSEARPADQAAGLGRLAGAARLTGGTPTVGPALDEAPMLAAVGLGPADYAGPAVRMAGCGLEFPYLSVVPDAVRRAVVPDPAAVPWVSVFSWDADARLADARVLCPGAGVAEDPATGSAALGFGVWLVASGLLPGDGTSSYTIRQGAALHRPSILEGTVTAEGGQATSATVAGYVVPIASGEIAVPPFVG
jgi:trans-2,3-dihydro-3-hydroxyanthranilate isomerase